MENIIGRLIGEVAIEGKDSLRGFVASSILENMYDNTDSAVMDFMNDVANYGCISGCVSGMIYYHETIKFYDEFSENIYDLFLDYGMDEYLDKMSDIRIMEMDEEMEEIFDKDVDLEKNELAWAVYEIMVISFLNEFEDELAV